MAYEEFGFAGSHASTGYVIVKFEFLQVFRLMVILMLAQSAAAKVGDSARPTRPHGERAGPLEQHQYSPRHSFSFLRYVRGSALRRRRCLCIFSRFILTPWDHSNGAISNLFLSRLHAQRRRPGGLYAVLHLQTQQPFRPASMLASAPRHCRRLRRTHCWINSTSSILTPTLLVPRRCHAVSSGRF